MHAQVLRQLLFKTIQQPFAHSFRHWSYANTRWQDLTLRQYLLSLLPSCSKAEPSQNQFLYLFLNGKYFRDYSLLKQSPIK